MDIHSVSREAKTCVLDRASTQVFRFAQDDYVATSGLIRATLRGASVGRFPSCKWNSLQKS